MPRVPFCVGVAALAVSLLALTAPGVAGGNILGAGVNGGQNCVACTFGVALLQQYSEMHKESVVHVLQKVCVSLPPTDNPAQLRAMCQKFVGFAGPMLVELLKVDPSPDTICQALGQCNMDSSRPFCASVPVPKSRHRRAAHERPRHERLKRSRDIASNMGEGMMMGGGSNICDMEGIKELCQFVTNSFRYLVPPNDTDHDFYGTSPTRRGSAWRGKDCNNSDPLIHPGAVPFNDDITLDSNCNGILGVNPETRQPYESELCLDSQPRGVAVLGDSMSAHFHVPDVWFDPTRISQEAFKHWQFVIENEVDWPHMSSVTGLGFNNWKEVIQGPIDSIYMRLRERNLCNHKDYQNIGINGAKASHMADYYVQSLSRNQEMDRPLIVFYAMLGMDVCNPYVDDTVAHMTKPAEMRQKVLQTLDYLDKILPLNSTVFLLGLPDGRLLYEALKDRVHPIARHWNTFTYAQFYDFFNCLQVTSCAGWMNTNSTIRDLTAKRAKELTEVLQKVATQRRKTSKHFDVYYMDYPYKEAIDLWERKGGQAWQLLDPMDGFHSNQQGQALIAHLMWEEAERLVPGVFGPPNPHNHRIAQLFGDQGSYF